MGSVSSVRRITLGGLSALVLSGVLVTSTSTQVFGNSGCPTAENFAAPVNGFTEIDTPGKLQKLKDLNTNSSAMSASYKLTADLNLNGCTWDSGISSSTAMFSGEFDGNSKTISNLTITAASNMRPDQGFIRYLSGSVHDLTLSSLTVSSDTTSAIRIGGLAGSLRSNASVNNVTLASVSVTGYQQVGGAFGETLSNATVQNITLSGSVTGADGLVGGLAGTSQATVSGVTSSVNVAGTAYVGGLLGRLQAGKTITNSSVSGSVTASNTIAGGAVGEAGGTCPVSVMTGITSSGPVSAPSYVGGLVGMSQCNTVDRSSSSSVVTATGARAGGLIGHQNNTSGAITKSFFGGQVQGGSLVGGLAGLAAGPITDSYSIGTVNASTTTGKAGGLIGEVYGPTVVLTRVFAAGAVTSAPSASNIGGLIGYDLSNYAVINSGVWDKGSTGLSSSANPNAKGFTTQQMKDFVLYNSDNLNWTITDGISPPDGITTGTTWSVCSGANSGYPFLTWQGLSGTCLPTMAYNENGATSGGAPLDPTTPYTSGSTVTVLGNTGTLARTGYVFDGWNTKANGTGTTYAAGDTFAITAPVMLFAKWLQARTITYNANSGTGTISSSYALSGSPVTLSSGSGFTRTSYTLTGWNTASLGNGTPYGLGATITMPASNTTLYAVWGITRYITYNSNSGSGSITALAAASGSSVTLSSGSSFTRSGYTLTGWNTASLGTGTPYGLGATITMPVSNTTLYAVWTSDAATTTTTTTSSTTTTTVSPATTTVAATTTTAVPATPCPEEAPPPRVGRLSVTCPGVLSPSPGASTTMTTTPRTSTTIRSSVTSGLTSSSSTTTSTTLLPPTTTSPTKTPAPDVPGVLPGDTGATVGGRPVDATVTHEGGDLVVVVDDATIRYSVTKPNGEKQPIPVGGSIALLPGSEISVRMLGLASVGRSEVWVSPQGLLIGDVELENGEGSIIGVVPDDVAGGDSRLVVKSKTSTGAPLVVAYGVAVQKQKSSGTSWSVVLFVIMGLAVVSGLFIPAARRRRDDEEEEELP